MTPRLMSCHQDTRRAIRICLVCFLGIVLALTLAPLHSLVQADEFDFARDILPLLQTHCIDCHGPDTDEAQLRLDSEVGALRGGDSGEPAVVPGASDRSYLITRILSADAAKRMPPDSDPLPDDVVDRLRQWIDAGDRWEPAKSQIESQSLDHWSFQPLRRPDVPTHHAADPIDTFIDSRLSDAQLSRSSQADRRKLIRRLYLVMHGLPPSPEQVQRFLDDPRPNAWSLLVEDVLASLRYGERWATHWLDLVRFGETHGFETNRERPNAWQYRDWVIDSLNHDKPYDQFIVEQIAGDAVGADVATGFLVAGPYDLVKGQDAQLRLMQRQDELADMVNTTGTAFLGLTIGCARCHNHKFDPISQTDYYAMQAVFAGVNHAERGLPPSEQTRHAIAAIDLDIAELRNQLAKFISKRTLRRAVNAKENFETFEPTTTRFVRMTINATNQSQPCIDEFEIFKGAENVALASRGAKATSSGDFVHPLHKLEHINDGKYGNARSWISSVVSGGWLQIEFPDPQPIDRIVWARDREGRYGDRLATDYTIQASSDGDAWQLLASSADRLPPESGGDPELAYEFDRFGKIEAEQGRKMLGQLQALLAQRETLARPQMVYAGTFNQPAPTHRLYRGEPGSPREQVAPAAIKSLTSLSLPADTPEQQRRLAIARWIADPSNPLTARVIVNRLWQFHFGTGIVDTPSDFGGNGTLPSHPELLDWLAAELIDGGWSLKHIHRLILNSQTWQQDSRPDKRAVAIDADSRLLWRFPPRRLEAEGIRDCMLVVTDKIDLKQGGPGFSAFQVDLENVRHYFPKLSFGPDDWRRMIYMTKVRQERDAVFGVFDCPDFNQVVPKRSRSTTPLQALNLLNSRFVMQQADLLVQRLHSETDSPTASIQRAYALCLGRPAEVDEVSAALDFIASTDWQQFARAILNANEFVFIP